MRTSWITFALLRSYLFRRILKWKIIWVSVVGAIIWTVASCVYKWYRLARKVNEFDGPFALPIVGNVFLYLGSPTDVFNRITRLYRNFHGRSFRIWYLNRPYIVLSNPKDINVASRLIEKDSLQNFLTDLIGDGIYTTNPEKWKHKRRIMSVAFNTTSVSTHFLAIFNKESQRLIRKLAEEVGTETTFDVYPYILRTTIQTLIETMIGSNAGVDEKSIRQFEHDLTEGTTLIAKRMARPWLHPSPIFKAYLQMKGRANIFRKIRNFYTKLITQKLDSNLENEVTEGKGTSMLEILTRKYGTSFFTAEELCDEFLTLIITGGETNALLVSFMLLMLAQNPDIQEMVHQEIYSVFGEDDRYPDIRDLSNLRFLEQCIKETMRKFSVIPSVNRQATEDVPLSDNLVIPSGANVMLPFDRVHNDPDIYPDPDTWNPYNFDAEKVAARPLNSFMPFGTGPRKCIGHKYAMVAIKAMTTHIIRAFKISTNQNDIELCSDILTRSRNGYKIQLHYRRGLLPVPKTRKATSDEVPPKNGTEWCFAPF